MKNYDKIAEDLFARRERYLAERRKRRKAAITAAVTGCFALAVLTGLGVWQSRTFHSALPDPVSDAATSGTSETVSSQTGASSGGAENKIVVNAIDTVPVSDQRAMINLNQEDFVQMTRTELSDYYGTNVFPELPDDLIEDPDVVYGIFIPNKSVSNMDDVYWDSNILCWVSRDSSRSVNLETDKVVIPIDFCNLYPDATEKSVINGTEVAIAQDDDGQYYAEFIYNGTGFRLIASGITQEEFVAIIASLT